MVACALLCSPSLVWAGDADRFLGVNAWQCSIHAELIRDIHEKTGPAGMAQGSRRQFFQALGDAGVKSENPGGDTDSYHETMSQSMKGKVRLHYVYDGGPDGIQIAGWSNGEAEVRIHNTFEGTEQNQTVYRDKVTNYNGPVKFEGEEVEPSVQIWIYPDQGVYALEYHLSPVRGQQVEHCTMKGGMEEGRQKAETATDAEMPLGSFFGGLTKGSCPTERKSEIDIDGGALSGVVEDIPIPAGLVFEGEGTSGYVNARDVKMRWSCKPE